MRKIVVMGVSGCGKSVIGAAVADGIGGMFIDGDDLHPQSNVAKMAAGTPLTDDDRAPWLDKVGATLGAASGDSVIGCSALKRIYRDRIRAAAGQNVIFVHLSGDKALIAGRMSERTGHFMPPALLDSQFAALEPPAPDERAVTVDIDAPPERIVDTIVAKLQSLSHD